MTITLAAQAEWEQQSKLLADDGDAHDHFGNPVALAEGSVIVGAPSDDDNGNAAGAAYLFDRVTGAQIAKLLPSDIEPLIGFGVSVSVDGDLALIGASGKGENEDKPGTVYLFDLTTGIERGKLLADDGAAGDLFGVSSAIEGTTAIIGARHDDDNGTDSGSAYLFDLRTGEQLTKILPETGGHHELFGNAVDLCGTTALIGAPSGEQDGENPGSAYLFDTVTGEQIFRLRPADSWPLDRFGWSVAMTEDLAIVGAPLDSNSGLLHGAVYVFDLDTGEQLAMLAPPLDTIGSIYFGADVAVSGTTLVVGAPADDVNGYDSGRVFLFDTTTFQEIGTLSPLDPAEDDWFGYTVDIDEGTTLVGASNDDGNGIDAGAAYIFRRMTTQGDLSGDGVIDLQDLLLLLENWGECLECLADLDGDGTVDVADLLILLDHWS